jgi:hypothetical protein
MFKHVMYRLFLLLDIVPEYFSRGHMKSHLLNTKSSCNRNYDSAL